MRCNAPTTPAVLSPLGEDADYTYLVMPVQIRA
jgi:DNA polymerase-3 subunit beta